ncbi:MAG: ABC transporter permease [bacterium]|nr:ABC transporter permease [bacterium]
MSRQTKLVPKLTTTQIALSGGRRSQSLWAEAIRNLFRNRSAIIGLIIIAALLLIALFAPAIAPYPPNEQLFNDEAHRGIGRLPGRPPCIHLLGCPAEQPQHLMGLDLNARDMFSRVIYGSQISLFVGFFSVIVSIFTGSLLGMLAGYAGGWVDNAIMRLMDVLLAFPSLLLAIAIVTFLGPGLQNALLAISIVSIPAYARLARASVLQVKEFEYITAVRTLGAPSGRILFGHILPNILTPLIVQGTLGIGTAVLDAAALSFLGLGAQPPDPEWGAILSEGRNRVFTEPHLVFFPGLAIMLTVLGFNLLGDGMRDALDPRLNRI